MVQIIKYNAAYEEPWNDFLQSAKNHSFLFNRAYMDYHSHTFKDHSLLLYRKGRLIAVFPANEADDTEIISHKGLSYGGLVIHKAIRLQTVLQCFYYLLQYLHSTGYSKIMYKSIPSFYYKSPAYEEEYALFLLNATLINKDMGFVIENDVPLPYFPGRANAIRKAKRSGIRIVKEDSLPLFWKEILIPNLKEKYNSDPVHTVDEIELLAKRFPKNILHYNAYSGKDLIAGATIFLNDEVAHTQYISANEEGKKNGALDLLFAYLIKEEFKKCKYFSFGTSYDGKEKLLHPGLVFWKESFGARAWPYHSYEIQTDTYNNLNRYV